MVRAGLSEEYGSWKTTRRSAADVFRCLSDIVVMSWPCSLTVPAVGGCRPRTALPIVDLPEPDSPTRPTVSPGAMSKLTPSMAGGACRALRPRAVADDEVADLQGRGDDRGSARPGRGRRGRSSGHSSGRGGLVGARARAARPAPGAISAPASSAPQVTWAPASSSTRMHSTEPSPWAGSAGNGTVHFSCDELAAAGEAAAGRPGAGRGHGAGDGREPHRAPARRRARAGSPRAAPSCTGAAGRPARPRRCRTRRPAPAYMTATSSQMSATTPRSWLTMTTDRPVSRTRARSRLRISACTVTSSAVVGSSAISSFGCPVSARAIATRCAMPPDSWCG